VGKNARRHKDEISRRKAVYVIALEEAVNAVLPKIADLEPKVTDFHLIGPFTTQPDGFCVFYVMQKNRDVAKAESKGVLTRLRQVTADELTQRGYPEIGVKTLEVKLVSQQDIDSAGGSFNYFR